MASYLGHQIMDETEGEPGFNVFSMLKTELKVTQEQVNDVISAARHYTNEVKKSLVDL